jgi:hypothetical protein
MDDTTMLWIVVALVGVAIAVAFIVASSRRRSRIRTAELQRHFGPEYDQAIREFGSPAKAERELVARSRRVDRIRFRELSDADRARFTSEWSRIQGLFVDDPGAAVAGANDLIKEVMRARGYPSDGFDQRAADLSVDHPEVVQHYRAARELSSATSGTESTTEERRQAVVHYRVLFADLLQPSTESPPSLRHAHV